jgi:hypothetical protein
MKYLLIALVALYVITFMSSSTNAATPIVKIQNLATEGRSSNQIPPSKVAKKTTSRGKKLQPKASPILFGRVVPGTTVGGYCECNCPAPPTCYVDGTYDVCSTPPGSEPSPGCGGSFRRKLIQFTNLNDSVALTLLKRYGVQ